MAASALDPHVAVAVGLGMREADPLTWFRFAVPRIAEAVRLFTDEPDPLDELAMRGPNKSGKTLTKAAIMLACLQCRDELDGVPLPHWRGRVEGVQLCLDYKQQLLSVKPAYLKLLGTWPHHVRYVGEALSSIHVKPRGCNTDDESQWSVVHFMTEKNRDTGTGVRADVVDIDEPADMEVLRELRKAAHAGRRCIILHGFTPTRRSQWAPVRLDYGDTPRRCIRRINLERAEVRWSLDELAPWVLDAKEKAKLLRTYAGDPLHTAETSAREHGDYTNTEASCPFDVETLVRLLGSARDPVLEMQRVSVEATTEGDAATLLRVPLEVFVPPRDGLIGYVSIDPASGIEGRNPAGLLVLEHGTGNLLARWNGYLAPYSLGVLAAGVARQYGNGWIDVEMKDHWGVNVIRGIEKGGHYGRICHEVRALAPGKAAKEAGWDNDEEAKKELIGAIQEWLAACRATGSVPYGVCPSRDVLNCLLDAELDEKDKIVSGDGVAHGEDMICWGRGLARVVNRSSRVAPLLVKPMPTQEEERRMENKRLADMIRGRNGHRNGHGMQGIPSPRRAPR